MWIKNIQQFLGKIDWAFVIYNSFVLLALALGILWLPVYFVKRKKRGKSYAGLGERFGWLPPKLDNWPKTAEPVIWIHCASVGEVNAAAPILKALRIRLPLAHFVLSVVTPAGYAHAQQRDLGVEAVFYFPPDIPFVLQEIFSRLQPQALILVETELWPNLLCLARRRGVHTIVVNGRISDRAFPWTKMLRPIYRWALQHVELIGTQSEEDAQRFIFLGANPERVFVGGNSKFDGVPEPLSTAEAARWRQEFGFGEEDLILLAGSTHEGEEEIILTVFDHLRFTQANLQLIIAPRHPQRGEAIHQLVREHGYDVYRRSHVLQARAAGEEIGPPSSSAARVVILDTIGELASVYACADLVIMGGSLVKGLSGHNILEPIAQGKFTLFGPYMADFRDISAIAIKEGCGLQVKSAEELQEQCELWLQQPKRRAEVAALGPAMLRKYAGASERYVRAIEELVEPSASPPAPHEAQSAFPSALEQTANDL